MQADYPLKTNPIKWDMLKVEYPVRQFPDTGASSKTIGHQWRTQPETIKSLREPIDAIRQYYRDYNITKDLTRSASAVDYGFKQHEMGTHNKHTPCTENLHIYPPSRRLADRPPPCTAYGTTEMRGAYKTPTLPPTLVTNKDQFKHPRSLPDPPVLPPRSHKAQVALDTTHDGHEKYLDPYLTTSRLHHRPYTAAQLEKPTALKDTITQYTFIDVPWTRTPKPNINDRRLSLSRPKSMYDREKFKQDLREIRTHNKDIWVPGAFRTEVRDNYKPKQRPESQDQKYDEHVRNCYQRSLANLPVNIQCEHVAFKQSYSKESAHLGSGIPLCSAIDQHVEKNRRLVNKSMRVCV